MIQPETLTQYLLPLLGLAHVFLWFVSWKLRSFLGYRLFLFAAGTASVLHVQRANQWMQQKVSHRHFDEKGMFFTGAISLPMVALSLVMMVYTLYDSFRQVRLSRQARQRVPSIVQEAERLGKSLDLDVAALRRQVNSMEKADKDE